jgi:hypothetical protein
MKPDTLSRRQFLAAGAALPFLLRHGVSAARIPVGLELYSVRDALTKDLHGTVRAVAKLGYEVVEFYSPLLLLDGRHGKGGTDAARRPRDSVPVHAQRRAGA